MSGNGLISLLAILVLVIGLHECGHAIAAWFFEVKIKRVSLGFGRPLLRFTSKNGCEWVWALWPLGGYVLLANTRISPVPPDEEKFCFDKKPIGQRVLILLSGAFANLLIAWLSLIFVFLWGLSYQSPEVGQVIAQSQAAKVKLSPGDQIVAVNDFSTPSWAEVGMALVWNWGQPKTSLTFLKEGHYKTAYFDLSQVSFRDNLLHSLGIVPNKEAKKHDVQEQSLGHAMLRASQTIWTWIYFFLVLLKQLIWGVIPFFILLGPLSFLSIAALSLTQGIAIFFFFIAQLSVAVALLNLFPLPSLDGGSIVYALLEKIRGKPLSIGFEVLLHQLFVIAFCLLFVHLVLNDLQRLLT